MMKLWFDVESGFNIPNFGRSYTIDISNERVQKNMEYRHVGEFMRSHATQRISDFHSVSGEVISELTYGNAAWSYLLGSLLGSRTAVSGYKFENTNRPWGILIGYANADITADSTSFEINTDEVGAFDGVDAIIINDELIEVSSILNDEVLACTRGTNGTTAKAHSQKDLVYGLVTDVARTVVLCHRNKVSGFNEFGYSLTTVLDRDSILFGYSGMQLSEISFNFRVFDTIVSHLAFEGADSTSAFDLVATSITDDNEIVDLEDVKVYSEHVEDKLRQFYIQLHNSIKAGSYGFNGIPQKLFMTGTSCFGVITWTDDSLDHVLQYEANTRRHMSLSMVKDNYRMIFAINNMRINTVSAYHDGSLIIQDSAPFYSYEEPVVLFQF